MTFAELARHRRNDSLFGAPTLGATHDAGAYQQYACVPVRAYSILHTFSG